MLALSELSKSWPVGGWILQLFVNLMKRLTGHDFGFQISASSSEGANSREGLVTTLQDDRSTGAIVTAGGAGEDQPDDLLVAQAQMTDDQPFMITPHSYSLNSQSQWHRGGALSPDFLFQDIFEVVPSFNDNLIYRAVGNQ
jgi:hypothetical protein